MLRDRVQCSTATIGTGTVTLGAATSGYRTFSSAFSATSAVSYVIVDGTAWETGAGTYTPGGNTLTRAFDASSTGALLNLSGNAVISVAFLSRDNVGDWPVFVGSSDQNVGIGSFTIVPLNNISTDTHGGWSAANNWWVCPQTGIYSVTAKIRITDNSTVNKSYGIGADTSNGDSPSFFWATTSSASPFARNGGLNARIMQIIQGAQLRLFGYSSDGLTSSAAELTAVRIR